jgi:hypothetical protein
VFHFRNVLDTRIGSLFSFAPMSRDRIKFTMSSWAAMHERCRPESTSRKYYFDRGIYVCDQWQDFKTFLQDMGPRPDDTSIDRINNNLGYFPKNCRWASRKEQSRNTRSNTFVEYEGELVNTTELAERFGLNGTVLSTRLRLGWPIREALTTPVHHRQQANKRKHLRNIQHKTPEEEGTASGVLRDAIQNSEIPARQLAKLAQISEIRFHRWLNRKTQGLDVDAAEAIYFAITGSTLFPGLASLALEDT